MTSIKITYSVSLFFLIKKTKTNQNHKKPQQNKQNKTKPNQQNKTKQKTPQNKNQNQTKNTPPKKKTQTTKNQPKNPNKIELCFSKILGKVEVAQFMHVKTNMCMTNEDVTSEVKSQTLKYSGFLSHGENLMHQREVCISQLCKIRSRCHPSGPLEISGNARERWNGIVFYRMNF